MTFYTFASKWTIIHNLGPFIGAFFWYLSLSLISLFPSFRFGLFLYWLFPFFPSSSNTLKVFSVFIFLSLVSFLCPSFLSVFFLCKFRFDGNLSLCSHLPNCTLIHFFSPCYHFCFLSLGVFFSSLTLFCTSMGSSLLLIGKLWLFVCGFFDFFLLLSLFGLTLSLLFLLLLPRMSFSPYTLVFPLLCTHHICQVSFYS